MHLIEAYSLMSGSKIKRPSIISKFFPLAVDKYITIHPNSKYDSKCYNFWQDVVDDILPYLKSKGISIVQIGTKDDRALNGCYQTQGQTNLGQAAYIISNSMLHVGADSFAVHIASSFGIKIVGLYSNNYINCVKPYWTKSEDCILLEPKRKGKPNFSAEENPKTINLIEPEKIANAILQLLGEEYRISGFETKYIGEDYKNKIVETIPDQIIDPKNLGIDSILVRMDYLFDQNILAQQLSVSKCSISTNKPIDLNIIDKFKHNIKEFILEVEDEPYVDFVRYATSKNINMFLVTKNTNGNLNKLKLAYLDFGMINIKTDFSNKGLDFPDKTNLKYKSSKITLSDGKIYPSYAAYLEKKPVDSFFFGYENVIDSPAFWKESNHFRIVG